MSWTYSGDPTTSSRDAVRFLAQDTDTARQLFADEELDFLISTEHNVYMAAAEACEIQAARQGAVKAKRVGSLAIDYFGPEEWKRRAAMLRARGSSHQVLSAGGVFVDDRHTLEQDTSLVQPYVSVGMHDNRSRPMGESVEDED